MRFPEGGVSSNPKKKKGVRKVEKQLNFYAKQSDPMYAYFFFMLIILLLFKEAQFNTNELDLCVSNVCVYLLQEFNDVFLDEISSGLPPLKGIDYQIDLIPGSTIPNRPTFKNNHEETNEIQR